MNSLSGQVCGVHLVGSVPYDNSTEVFHNVEQHLGKHIKRLPDGETGIRTNWIDWQLTMLKENPNLQLVENDAFEYTQVHQLGLAPGGDSKHLQLGELGYARVALESFEEFSKLKSSGQIPQTHKFQVCLPTPLAISHIYVEPGLQADFEPQYEEQLLNDLDRLLSNIPHEELAIQWDTAVEFAVLEGIMPSYIENLKEGIIERLLRLAHKVPQSVDMGFHLCYGDSQHKHFCEPKDTGLLVSMTNSIVEGLSRSLNWVHMPVPKERSDEAYYKPLADLKLGSETELYLGLVHFTDGEAGALERIESAGKYVQKFGVATECGFGRRPRETLVELMGIHASVSAKHAE